MFNRTERSSSHRGYATEGSSVSFYVTLAVTSNSAFPAASAMDTLSQGVTLPAKVRVLATLDIGNVATRVIVAVRGEMSR